MSIKAVVFDIGGVLEVTPSTGWQGKWEQRLGLSSGQLREQMFDTWRAGSLGTINLADVHTQTAEILAIDPEEVNALMDDVWHEYLGTLNHDLYAYFRGLRSRVQTAILSNSFVGAREREQAKYGFKDSCDFIIYSHEVGLSKPDPRIYALTCERLNKKPHEVLFLDNSETLVEAAVAIGMHGVVFKDTAQAIHDIELLLQAE